MSTFTLQQSRSGTRTHYCSPSSYFSLSLSFFFSPLVISQTLILRATAYRLWARAMLGDANLMSHLCRLCRRPVAIIICVSLKGYKWTPTPTTVPAPTPHTLSPSHCFLNFTCSSIVVNLRLVIEWECLLARPRPRPQASGSVCIEFS